MNSYPASNVKRSIFGLYWRKTSFFVGLFVVGFLAMSQVSYYQADTKVYSPSNDVESGDININVAVNADGSILVDGKKIAEKVNILGNNEEIILPIIEGTDLMANHAKVTMTLPKPVAYSSTYEAKIIHGGDNANSYIYDNQTIIYEVDDIVPTSTFSVIVGMPKGTLDVPLSYRFYAYLANISANMWLIIGLALPIMTLIFMLLLISYEMRRQRVEVPSEETSAPPMALPPALVGVLYRQNVTSREIAATLIDLAIRGDIIIMDRIRDFAFAKKRLDQRLLSFEKILLSKVFKQGIISNEKAINEQINSHLYSQKISFVTAGIYVLATRLGYFRANPHKVHQKYIFFGLSLFLVGAAGFVLSIWKFSNPPYIVFFWIGMMLSALITATLSKNIPVRTVLGQEALSNWLGFKKYLSSRDKIPFSYENQQLFQRYLPYAIVLDCEVLWAKRFSEQNFAIPDWFVSEKSNLGLQDFCLSLFPIVSYVARNFASIREPGYK